MIADWVEMTSSTGGTGALTLSSVTGSPGYAAVFGSTAVRYVHYTISQYTDSTRSVLASAEAGVGSLDLSTLILTRTRPVATWNGTTYVTVAPSALSFSATSGLIRVTCEPGTASASPVQPAFVVTTAAGDGLGLVCGTGEGYGTITLALVANTEYYVPFLWAGAGDIVQAGIDVTTAVASTNLKAGVYEVGADGLPGTRLIDATSGAVLSTATTGIKTSTVAAALPPGWYYAALLASGAPTLRALNVNTVAGPAGTISGLAVNFLKNASGSYATGLPATRSATLTGVTASSPPLLYLKPRN